MHIAISHADRSLDLLIDGLGSATTLGEVLDGFGLDQHQPISIDGRPADRDAIAAEVLHEGAELSTTVLDQPPKPTVELHMTRGPAAGHVWRLAPGVHRISTDSENASPDSSNHEIVVRVDGDDVSVGGIPAPRDVEVSRGDAWFRIDAPSIPDDTRDGPVTFNRPPRIIEPPPAAGPVPPSRTREHGKPRRLSVIALVLPAVFGVSMAFIFGRLMFLAFALMGPLMMVGNTFDDRRRRKRDRIENEANFQSELAAFRVHVGYHLERLADDRIGRLAAPAQLLSRIDAGTPSLWERRPHHADFMHVPIGTGDLPWKLSITSGTTAIEPEVAATLEEASLRNVPVDITLTAGAVVGVHGPDRDAIASLIRAMMAGVAAHHGPADVRIAVLTDAPTRWDWIKWLPHVAANDGEARLLAVTTEQIGSILRLLRSAPDEDAVPPLTLLVCDLESIDPELRTLHREVIAGAGLPVSAVVARRTRSELPGSATHIIEFAEDTVRLTRPSDGARQLSVAPWTMTRDAAHMLARRMARFDDPEAVSATSTLADTITLFDALGLTEPTPDHIAARWQSSDPASLRAPLGSGTGGTLEVDLVSDGPHGLVAGTTGSGKSELLRSLVATLAASYDTEHLTFVLIDYKGGSAFDACARLPHVVGLVTDLDEHLGARALTCLEAELRYREARLRDAGASDIREYGVRGGEEALPRMVLIVDEFAALAAELPDFMAALVDIAQRGRSLGVHMILATQRPSGVVKDSIRANTNLRISLRVQTPADSRDVIADPIASRIPRNRPGRAFMRLGPGELVPFQSTISTLSRPEARTAHVRLSPFVFSMFDPPSAAPASGDGPSELEVLVDATVAAHADGGFARPRSPWPPPLPTALHADELGSGLVDGLEVRIGLRDEPEMQRHTVHTWDPSRDGNLLLVGSNGPSDALRAIAGALATTHPDEVHIYGIDHGGGRLDALAALPHAGAIIDGSDRERQQRLLRSLHDEIAHRKASRACTATIVFLLEGLGGFRATFDDMADLEYRDLLGRIAADGPSVGVYTVIGADQARSIPGAMLGTFRTRLVFELADRLDYSTLGINPRSLPELSPRRAVDVESGRHVQIVGWTDDDIAQAASACTSTRTAAPVESLAETVKLADVMHSASAVNGVVKLPIGISDVDLQPIALHLHAGDHALITGSPRSGKSTALASIAAATRHLDPDAVIIAVCTRPSLLRYEPAVTHHCESAESLTDLMSGAGEHRVLVLIDDADEVDDDGTIEAFMQSRVPGHHLIAAARSDALRGSFRHWTKTLRGSRRGLVLCPHDPGDGEPLGVRLPRAIPVRMPPGRGYLCDGAETELIQSAIP